jgi:MFS family permease
MNNEPDSLHSGATATPPLAQATRAAQSAPARTEPFRSIATVLGAGLGLFTTTAAFLIYTFGVFLRPIAADTDWDRATLAGVIGPGVLILGLSQPGIGWLADRFSPVRVGTLGMVSTALALVLLGKVPWNASSFFVCYCLAMFMAAAQSPLPYMAVVTRNFEARRGLALGLASAFTGLGVALFPWLASRLIERFGWRNAYVALGVAILLVMPFVWWLLAPTLKQARTGAAATTLPSAQSDLQGLSLREAARTLRFWTFALGYFLANLILGSVPVFLPAILGDWGLSPQRAALSMSVLGLSMIAGRIFMGALLDRVFAPLLFAVAMIAPVAGSALLATAPAGVGVASLVAALFGVAVGAEFAVLAYISSRAFGRRYFGQNYGALSISLTLGGSIGPFLFSQVFRHYEGYTEALWMTAAMGSASALVFFTVRRSALPFHTR